MKTLLQLSAFFKNDLPGGIGITLTRDYGDLDRMLHVITTNYDAMWREAVAGGATRALIDDLIGQLQTISHGGPHISPADVAIVIGNIYLLEKVSEIRGDEYNGLMLCYFEENT